MYSNDGYSIKDYGGMVHDATRTKPFVSALRDALKPGSVVLDIGTGTGIFAFLACQLGAARVYAIEPNDAIEVAKLCAKGNANGGRITWIQGISTDVALPEQVDVVIGDLHGSLPFYNGNIESMVDARKRHLKPGGRMIPARDLLYAVPAYAPAEYRYVESPWRANDYGIDLRPGAHYVVNQWWRAKPAAAKAEHLLSSPQLWGTVNYATVETGHLDHAMTWSIERAGLLHGLYVWFDGDMGDGVGYSNAPQLPELVYGRAFFPFERPTEVIPGDQLTTRLSVQKVKGSDMWRWQSKIASANGAQKARFDQSTFRAGLSTPEQLHKASADHVPALTVEGQIALKVLKAMGEGKRLQDIAMAVTAQFPHRFESPAAALDAVSRLSLKYA